MSQAIRFLLSCLVLASLARAQKTPETPVDGPDIPLFSGESVPAGCLATINGRKLSVQEVVDAIYLRFFGHPKGQEAMQDLLQRTIIAKNSKDRKLSITNADALAEYQRLDALVKEDTKGASSIAQELAKSGRSREEFLRTLKIQIALKTMAKKDFGRDQVSPADQQQWLRSKTLDARITYDQKTLPTHAAAKVYDQFVTREDFARNVTRLLPREEVVNLVTAMMQSELAQAMLAERDIRLTRKRLSQGYDLNKKSFEDNPETSGINFEDFLKERTGMSPEAYQKSPGFFREVCLSNLGTVLVTDDQAAKAYQEDIDYYGPVFELRHILVQGNDNPKSRGVVRSMQEAKKQAVGILGRIKKGEKFEEAVRLYSDDPTSKFREGAFHKLTPTTIRTYPALEKEMQTMKVGDVRGPIESLKGYHLIKLHTKTAGAADLREDRSRHSQTTRHGEIRRSLEEGHSRLRPPLPRGQNRLTVNSSYGETIDALKREIVDVCKRMYGAGLIVATDGNVSIRIAEDEMLITRSGICKGDMSVDDVITVGFDGQALDDRGSPSSEVYMHIACYEERRDIAAVVHGHPPTAVAFTLAGQTLAQCVIPEVVLTMGLIPTLPYTTPTTSDVPDAVRRVIRYGDALMLERHGAVCAGVSATDAFYKLEKIEHAAHVTFMAHQLGRVKTLEPSEIRRLLSLRSKFDLKGKNPLCNECIVGCFDGVQD